MTLNTDEVHFFQQMECSQEKKQGKNMSAEAAQKATAALRKPLTSSFTTPCAFMRRAETPPRNRTFAER